GRLTRWHVQRKAMCPETAGLCGCWQFIAVRRERQYLRQGKVIKEEDEYAYYVTSLAQSECTAKTLLEIIRGHWDAVENSSHHRRDVTLGEDASRIRGHKGQPTAARVMATFRNLVLGLFECQKDNGQTESHVPGWQRKMTGSKAIRLIKATPKSRIRILRERFLKSSRKTPPAEWWQRPAK